MIIRVDEIPEGGEELLLTGDEPLLREALDRILTESNVVIDPHVTGRLRVVKDNDLVFLVGPIVATVSHQCSRCLTSFDEERLVEVDLVFRRADRTRRADESGTMEVDEEAILFEGSEIDPSDALVQEFMLDMPINPICREDCPGLCPNCGALKGSEQCCGQTQEPTDPRWATLGELKKKLSS
jgi:uncharacterized protein